MSNPSKKKHLWDAYRFPGFTPSHELKGVFGDHKARVIQLSRRQKKHSVVSVALLAKVGMIREPARSEIFPAAIIAFIWSLRLGVLIAGFVEE